MERWKDLQPTPPSVFQDSNVYNFAGAPALDPQRVGINDLALIQRQLHQHQTSFYPQAPSRFSPQQPQAQHQIISPLPTNRLPTSQVGIAGSPISSSSHVNLSGSNPNSSPLGGTMRPHDENTFTIGGIPVGPVVKRQKVATPTIM